MKIPFILVKLLLLTHVIENSTNSNIKLIFNLKAQKSILNREISTKKKCKK